VLIPSIDEVRRAERYTLRPSCPTMIVKRIEK